MPDEPILVLDCDRDRLSLLSWETGFTLDDPGWRPQQPTTEDSFSDSPVSEGRVLVMAKVPNVIESISLVARGTDPSKALATIARLSQMLKRASDYWTEGSEYSDVWLEARGSGMPAGSPVGYARIAKASFVDYSNPFGQPFFSQQSYSVIDGISLVVEREPYWRLVAPGQVIGPLYNLLRNPDFEQWNAGVTDSQPDCWDDLETAGIIGTNARDQDGPKWGRSCLKVSVTNSTGAGQAKGVTQVAEGTEDGQTYTLVGWVRSDGITGGVGRVLITSLLGQYEAWRGGTDRMGWTLVTLKFTSGVGDVIGINCEVLSTAAGCTGAVYFDSLMLLPGDFVQYAQDGLLPYLSSSHVYNHTDGGAGHVNYLDCWEVPGDTDSLIRLEVTNNTTPANFTNVVEKFGRVYVGQRRTGDVQNFQNDHDPAGVVDATCSNGDRLNITPTPEWADVTSHAVIGEGDVSDNVGRFRVLARLYDAKGSGSPTLEARLAYWLGQTGAGVKQLSGVTLPQRATWNMVNLTGSAAMIMDSKFRSNYPGSLTYTVQLRRPTGTGDARLDYVLQLPTDGGFLEAEVTPGLEQGVALVADNTASQSVSATGVRAGYVLRQELSDYLPSAFANFKGELYLCTTSDFMGGPTGGVWRRRSGTWSKVYSTTGGVVSIEVYNGALYGLHKNAASTLQLIKSADGTAWSVVATVGAFMSGYVMKSYGGYLWLGCEGTHGFVYRWDGTTLTLNYTIPDSGGLPQPPYSMEIYRDHLFFGTGTTAPANVYEYNGAAWSLLHSLGEIYANSMRAFNGKLYVGTSGNGKIFSFDGSTWTLVHDDSALGFSSAIQSMAVRDDRLVAASNVIGAALSKLKYTTDGSTWTDFYNAGSLDSMWALVSFEGDLLMGSILISTSLIYTFVADKPYEYSIANYQMGGGQDGGFTAPNRRLPDDTRRHRWVFSVDRSDGSHHIDDRLLVGVGFVPRYSILPSRR